MLCEWAGVLGVQSLYLPLLHVMTIVADAHSCESYTEPNLYSLGISSLVCLRSVFFFFSSRRRHTRFDCDWSSDVCSSDLSNLSVAADWANHTLQIKQCTWSDSIGNFSGRASWNLRTKAADFQGRSTLDRSEERRVGKECRSRWSPYH